MVFVAVGGWVSKKVKKMKLPTIGTIEAFAMIVDINGFTTIVSKSAPSECVAQFVRDVLSGGISVIQKNSGTVVGFMGDAFLAVIDNADSVFKSCAGIAKDVDRQREYVSNHQTEFPEDWHYAVGGVGLKIGIEYGWMDISSIHSDFLGEQRLLIGPPINYASRITSRGKGNRALVGPKAMKMGLDQWANSGPYPVKGKTGEDTYQCWELNLGDIWRTGKLGPRKETYWG
jgi:class 3 adenylate cyclase